MPMSIPGHSRKQVRPIVALALLTVLTLGPHGARGDDRMGTPEDLEEYYERGTPKAATGMSLAPILAYEPTFGTIFGGAAFLEKPFDPRYRLFTRLAFSTKGEYSALFDLRKWYLEEMFYRIEVEVDDFARPYYGEGPDTDPDDRIFLKGTVARVLYHFNCRKDLMLNYGPFLDFRAANGDGVEGDAILPPEYNEATLGIGFCLTYNTRDSDLSPTSGWFNTYKATLVPDSLTTYPESRTFLQAEIDQRAFRSLGEGLVLAGRLNAGGSWGTPSYQYRYSLGGPYLLRGLFTNRTRGDKFYVLQGELRKHLLWFGSGVIHAGVGEATDDWFGSPSTSYGFGLRFTLPPDHVAKARLDFAWTRDQRSIYFIFGEAF